MSSICPECKFLIICDALHKDSIIECEDFENKQKTNADRIRAMTDEELAEFLERKTPWYRCKDCCLDWLKEEAGE